MKWTTSKVCPVLLSACVAVGCSGGAARDAGPTDAAARDAGRDDAGRQDAGPSGDRLCTRGLEDGDRANNEPDWSSCEEGDVCVLERLTDFDADDAPVFRCVTPTPRPAPPWGIAIANGWAAYETPTARCNNGDAVRYWFRPARDDTGAVIDSDDWLVYLKGGDVCVTATSCAARWSTHRFFVAPPESARWTPNEHGIFRSRDNALSRINQVYVHYCTSDTWRGLGPRSPNTGFHHDGMAAVDEILDALEAGLGWQADAGGAPRTFTFQAGSRLVFSGGSAGSVGAGHLLDHVAQRLRPAGVVGLLDSVWVAPVLPSATLVTPRDYDYYTDESCAAANPTETDLACGPLFRLAPYLDAPFFATMSVSDGKAYPYAGVCVRAADPSTCVAPDRVVDGRCLRPTAVEPVVTACDHGDLSSVDPHGLGCWDEAGAGGDGYVVGERSMHVNECRSEVTADGLVDADGDCGAGMTCWAGHCVRDDFLLSCRGRSDCPNPEDACARGVCVHAAVPDGPGFRCLDPDHVFDEDTLECSQTLGCGEDADCASDEVCLGKLRTPAAGAIRLGSRQAFSASDADGYFVLNDRTLHTLINTSDDAFFRSYSSMRPEGSDTAGTASIHAALVAFLRDGPSPTTRLMQDP